MKVLQIASSYDTSSVYKLLFSHLKEEKCESEVYVPIYKNKVSNIDDVYLIDKKPSTISKILYWGLQEYIYRNIKKRMDLSTIECIHSHRIFYSGYAAMKISKEYNIPYVVSVRNSDLYGTLINMRILRHHSIKILLLSQKVIFISKAYHDYVIDKIIPEKYKDVIRKKSVIINNGINSFFLQNKFSQLPKSFKQEHLLNLISVGEISDNKNIVTTIKACELLILKGYAVHLLLVGDILKHKYNDIINKYSFVSHIPKCSQERVLAYLRQSDIFVMPSVHETFGLVYAEAMSQGVPIIYTNGQGFDGQYAEGVVGFSVDCFDYKTIANRIIDIINNYDEISNNCVSMSENFNWNIIANKYVTIYKESIANIVLTNKRNNNATVG